MLIERWVYDGGGIDKADAQLLIFVYFDSLNASTCIHFTSIFIFLFFFFSDFANSISLPLFISSSGHARQVCVSRRRVELDFRRGQRLRQETHEQVPAPPPLSCGSPRPPLVSVLVVCGCYRGAVVVWLLLLLLLCDVECCRFFFFFLCG